MLCVWHYGASDQWASVPKWFLAKIFAPNSSSWSWVKNEAMISSYKHQENYSETELTKAFHLAS